MKVKISKFIYFNNREKDINNNNIFGKKITKKLKSEEKAKYMLEKMGWKGQGNIIHIIIQDWESMNRE